ncbi:MAG: tail fiber domain-containing protein [Parvibaculaceae bacterium]
MGKSKAPKPPDPVKTAAAQTASNIGTALAEGAINRVDQVTPDGALTYARSGMEQWRDPLSGRVYDIPRYTATTTLSAAQQRIKDEEDRASLNLAALAAGQSGRLQGLLDRPLDLGNEAVESRLLELGARRLEPRLAEARRRAETDAASRGIRLGSAAYDRLMRGVGETENDAWTQLLLSGRGQALNELLTERNQPLNEISALLSGSAVAQPRFVGTPQADVANTDYAGLVNANYQQQLAAWQQQQQNQNDLLGGLLGIGAAFAGNPSLKFSDRRLKEDVEKVGETNDGQNIYSYHYKGDKRLQLGLIAQEVQRKKPGAIITLPGGVKAVDYRKALHLGEGARVTS